jgi:hypothetical protein
MANEALVISLGLAWSPEWLACTSTGIAPAIAIDFSPGS